MQGQIIVTTLPLRCILVLSILLAAVGFSAAIAQAETAMPSPQARDAIGSYLSREMAKGRSTGYQVNACHRASASEVWCDVEESGVRVEVTGPNGIETVRGDLSYEIKAHGTRKGIVLTFSLFRGRVLVPPGN